MDKTKEKREDTNYKKYRNVIRYCLESKIFFQPNRIYDIERGFYLFGDMGARLKNNIKRSWFQTFVDNRDDIYSFEGTVLSATDVWKGSGHKIHFDFVIGCKGAGELHWYSPDRFKLKKDEINEILDIETPKEFKEFILHKNLNCPVCREKLEDFRVISTIFKAKMEKENSEGYDAFLRPETCQDIFLNFKKIVGRELQFPFGIAQIGKVFRNEATQRRCIFRCREFELMELEYFIDPREKDFDPLGHEEFKIRAKPAEMEGNKVMEIRDLINSGIIESKWLAYWIIKSVKWLESIGIERKNLRIKQQPEERRAHYSYDTWDLEYRFDWGWDEIEGVAYRKDHDMRSHTKYHKQRYHKEDSYLEVEKSSNLFCNFGDSYGFPFVIETSHGLERTLLAILYESYNEKKGRPAIRFKPHIAPYTVAVFPHRHREDLIETAMKIYDNLKTKFPSKYHRKNERIGKKYQRFDKLGVPFCISVGDEIKEGKVNVSDRYRGEEELIYINEVDFYIWKKIYP